MSHSEFEPEEDERGVEITSESTLREIKQRIGVGKNEEIRESEKRRRYLQKLARLVTPARPNVKLTHLIPTAAVNQGGEQEDMPDRFKTKGDEPLILMSTREFQQAATEYPRRVFDAMVQKALLIHEVGHILYTESESHQEYVERVEESRKRMFHKTWNALEDAAIETQLRREYAVTHELDVLNSNLMSEDEIGHRIDDDTLRFSFFQAVTLGILDMGCYNSGLFAKLMNPDNDKLTFAGDEQDFELMEELIPDMKKVVKAVTTEPVSAERNKYIWEFWKTLEEFLDDASVSGEKESGLESLLDGEGNIGSGGGGSGGEEDDDKQSAPIFGKPDDSNSDFGGNAQPATALSQEDLEEAIEEGIQAAMSGGDADSAEENTNVNEPASGMDDEKEEQYQQEIASEASELDGGEQTIDEAEEYLDIIKNAAEEAVDQQRSKGGLQGGPEWRGLTLEIPDRQEYNTERYNRSQRRANRLARVLRNRLQRERGVDVLRNRRRGQLSTSGGTLMRVEREDFRVFETTEERGEKDYHAMFVLDRSGSMNGQPIRDAEESVGSMAYALEKVNRNEKIKVSVMDLYQSQARLVLPFGVDVDTKRGNLFSGLSGGGTPLHKAVYLARNRVLQEDSHPFMIVVTDGRPSNLDQYREELQKANFPILGVYITSRGSYNSGVHGQDEDLFDKCVYVTDPSEVDDALMTLCQQVMF